MAPLSQAAARNAFIAKDTQSGAYLYQITQDVSESHLSVQAVTSEKRRNKRHALLANSDSFHIWETLDALRYPTVGADSGRVIFLDTNGLQPYARIHSMVRRHVPDALIGC